MFGALSQNFRHEHQFANLMKFVLNFFVFSLLLFSKSTFAIEYDDSTGVKAANVQSFNLVWDKSFHWIDSVSTDSTVVDSIEAMPTQFEMKVGARNELYDASGIDERRPRRSTLLDITGKATNATYHVEWDAHLTTEDLSSSQAIDKVTLFGEMFGIGKLTVGDLYPKYSEYGLNGITVRGADIALQQGIFQLQMTSGFNQRAVEGDSVAPTDGTFMRYLAAGKLSIGNEKSFIGHLSVTKVKDKLESITTPLNTKPQESLIGSLNFATTFFDDMLKFSGEANISDHTRDTRSELFKDQFTLFGQPIFKTRLSSRVSMAYFSTLDLKLPNATIIGRYRRVEPGYTSLGAIRTDNDYQDVSLDGRYTLFSRMISARTFLSYRNDNLDDSKIATSKLIRLLQTGYFTFSRNLSVSLSYSLFLDKDNNEEDTVSFARNGLTQGLTLSPMLSFGSISFFNRIWGLAAFNRLKNAEGTDTRSNYDNYNFMLGYACNIGASFSATVTNSTVRMLQSFTNIAINTTELVLEPTFFQHALKLRCRGAFSYTRGKELPDRHWETGLGIDYRFTTHESLSLQLRSTWHNPRRDDSFSEFRWWVNYIHDIL